MTLDRAKRLGDAAPVQTAAEQEDAHKSKNDEEECPNERDRGKLAWRKIVRGNLRKLVTTEAHLAHLRSSSLSHSVPPPHPCPPSGLTHVSSSAAAPNPPPDVMRAVKTNLSDSTCHTHSGVSDEDFGPPRFAALSALLPRSYASGLPQ